jgi:hypothetical protein
MFPPYSASEAHVVKSVSVALPMLCLSEAARFGRDRIRFEARFRTHAQELLRGREPVLLAKTMGRFNENSDDELCHL